MAKTGLGILVTGAAAFAFLWGFLIGSLAPALVGFALLAYEEGARRSSRHAKLSARRSLPRRTAVGDRIRVQVTVESPSGLPLEVEDEVPDAFAVLSRRAVAERGAAREDSVLRAREPGEAQWRNVHVTVRDVWGLHQDRRQVRLAGSLAVSPEPGWEITGKKTGRRHAVQATVPRRLALEPTIDVEQVREFHPGDRVRDIDWPRTSRLGQLYTRERVRVAPRPFLILLDATTSMRTKRRAPKLATAMRLAYGLAGAAQAAGVSATLVAFTEDGVARTEHTRRRRKKIKDTLDALAKLPAPVLAEDVPVPGATRTPSPDERELAAALAPFRAPRGTAESPLDDALATINRSVTGPAFVVAILDAEIQPNSVERAVHHLSVGGHTIVIVAPATGAHHFRRHEARGAILRNLVEARMRRERLRRRLAARHVPVFSLRPENAAQVLEEVARWGQ